MWFYIKNILICLDQLCNTLLGGYPDETLSSRAYRLDVSQINSLPRKLIDTLLWFDTNHCEESFISERIGRQLPPECRK